MIHYTISFYVACSRSLRDGIKHGVWIDALSSPDQMREDIDEMLSNSIFAPDAHDWRITRYEAPEDFCFLDSETSLEELSEVAEFIEKMKDKGVALLKYLNGNVREANHMLLHRFVGHFDSAIDFAKSIVRKNEKIPENVRKVINYSMLWKNLEKTCYIAIRSDIAGVYIFKRTM